MYRDRGTGLFCYRFFFFSTDGDPQKVGVALWRVLEAIWAAFGALSEKPAGQYLLEEILQWLGLCTKRRSGEWGCFTHGILDHLSGWRTWAIIKTQVEG